MSTMLRVEASAQRRFAMLGGVVAVLLGSVLISGMVERFSASARSSADSVESLQIRQQAEETRMIREEAMRLGRSGHWEDTVRFLDRLHRNQPVLPSLRSEAALRAGRIKEARQGFLLLIPIQDPVSAGTRLFLRGQNAEYRSLCQKTLEATSKREMEATDANNAAWLCAIAPNALDDYTQAIDLAKIGVIRTTDDNRTNFLNTLGAVEFRAGHFAEAIAVLEEAERQESEPFNWPFLAMAYHRAGNSHRAKDYYYRLREHLDKTFGRPGQTGRHELLLFFSEAEEMLGIKGSAKK